MSDNELLHEPSLYIKNQDIKKNIKRQLYTRKYYNRAIGQIIMKNINNI